jgi:hypothetical protein
MPPLIELRGQAGWIGAQKCEVILKRVLSPHIAPSVHCRCRLGLAPALHFAIHYVEKLGQAPAYTGKKHAKKWSVPKLSVTDQTSS